MPQVSATVTVGAPAAHVWTVVTDWARQGEWIPATTVRVARGTGAAVGDQVVATTGLAGLRFDDPMEVTVWNPPHRCDVRHLGRVVRGSGSFVVDAVNPTTARFTWTEDVDAPFGSAGVVVVRLLRPALAAVLRVAMRRLARLAATP